MAHVSAGPVSTLPGSCHKVPEGQTCDDHDELHEERPAVVRIQGETDSFGAEYVDWCQECYDKYLAEKKERDASELHWCDHCKAMIAEPTYPVRDPDEGTTGPVYEMCAAGREALRRYHADEGELD